MLNRRLFSASLLSSFTAACTQDDARGGPITVVPGSTLKELAQKKGMFFGAAVVSDLLLADPAYRIAIERECGVLVPEAELKWGMTEPHRGMPDFSKVDSIFKFTQKNGMRMRGHTAAWYRNIPKWVEDAFQRDTRALDILYQHVYDVVSRYKGQIFQWDVVNEAIEPKDGLPGYMRNSTYYKRGGADYIAECFNRAHAADPSAMLFYNDYGLEYDTPYAERRRQGTLELLRGLRARNVPVHALGIQSHLSLGKWFSEKIYAAFLADVASLGLKIVLTELDVDDGLAPADIRTRDQQVADHVRNVLAVAFDQPSVIGLMTWGISDRYSWLDAGLPRKDLISHRGLPLDPNFRTTPMWMAIAQSFAVASSRG